MRRRRDRNKRTARSTISIIVDGKTEKWYLQMMRDYERFETLKVEPELQSVGIERQFELLCEKAEMVDVVIWLLDADTLNKELAEDKTGTMLNKWRSYLSKVKKIKNAYILFNTPCLEYWFLLHLENTNRTYRQCAPVLDLLRKSEILSNYEKSERYYKNQRMNIYERLKPNQSDAQKRSKQLGRFNLRNANAAKAEIYKIFELLHDRK